MEVNPQISFWIGVVISVAVGIGGGTVSLTNVIPEQWIPIVQAWTNLFAFVGTTFLTALHAVSSPKKGPLAKKDD